MSVIGLYHKQQHQPRDRHRDRDAASAAVVTDVWRHRGLVLPLGFPSWAEAALRALRHEPAVSFGEFSELYFALVEMPQLRGGLAVCNDGSSLVYDFSVFDRGDFDFSGYLADLIQRHRLLARAGLESSGRFLELLEYVADCEVQQ